MDKSILKHDIGAFLRQIRMSRSLNIGDVSDLTELSEYIIRKAESGDVSIKTLIKLSALYEVSFDALVRERDLDYAS